MISDGVVVIGAGQAGFELARALRSAGYDEPIRLVSDESGLPYQRPPLSKGFLAGQVAAHDLLLADDRFFPDNRIEIVAGKAVNLELTGRRIVLADGRRLSFDHIVFATGARNRLFKGVRAHSALHSIRTHADAMRLGDRMRTRDDIAIVGAGFLGLEAASTWALQGKNVIVLEAQDRVMARGSSAAVSAFFASKLGALGVRLELGLQRLRLESAGPESVRMSWGGGTLDADVVLTSIGVLPNTELAAAAGLPCDNGILVDEFLNVGEARNIFAIGDCARFPSRHFDGMTRLESVQNAVEQAQTVAAAIAGERRPYRSVPWFWTEQAGAVLQIVGDIRGDEAALIGEPADEEFSAFHFRCGALIGAESVNMRRVHMRARRLIGNNENLSPSKVRELFAHESA
ncbi:MAG: FAD-dependent oxidoreductase [Mesorhizobium sp.]|nr:FAD-dependent oxidoreductase [Mesorhizobium sp.]